jgi:hypothetical protein
MKKMAVVFICAMLLSTIAVSSQVNATTANPGWYNTSVSFVGALPLAGLYSIVATSADQSFPAGTTYLIDATNPETKSMLATVLTGYANSGPVALYLPNGIAAYSFCSGVAAGVVP